MSWLCLFEAISLILNGLRFFHFAAIIFIKKKRKNLEKAKAELMEFTHLCISPIN